MQIASIGPDTSSYEDTGLIPNTIYYYRVRAVAGPDTSSYSNISSAFTMTVNVDEHFNSKTVELFPNPASSHLQLNITNDYRGDFEIVIKDFSGKNLYQSGILNKQENQFNHFWERTNWAAGMYLVMIKYEGRSMGFPFQKIK